MKIFEWDDLRVFLAIYRGRSVRAAAKLMGVSKSTMSRRLQAMESQLGITLFVRHAEGLILTEIGEAMLERAERVEQEIFAMERELFGRDKSLSGPIRITMPPPIAQYLVMPIIGEFAALYPDIEIEVDTSFAVADLSRRNADIAIRLQASQSDHLIKHRLPDLNRAYYATPEYIEAHTFSGDEPSARRIAWEPKGVEAGWRNSTSFANCKIQHYVSDQISSIEAVKAGMGFSDFLCFMADREPKIQRVPSATELEPMSAWILTHRDVVTTERVRTFVKFLVEALSKQSQE